MIENSTIATLNRYLDLTSRRQGLVAENVANIDTPGYRTRDVDFGGELQKLMNGESEPPAERRVPGLIERPDGNNVSADREGFLLGQTQLQFRTGVQLLRSQFQRLSLAINEGRNV
jgi:flagellar basal-body rod protein FlgB